MSPSAEAIRRREAGAVAGRTVGTIAAMAGIREKVAAGHLDLDFVAMARGLAVGLVVGRPTDFGNTDWSSEDYEELVMAMVARVTPAKIVVAAVARDDVAFSAWIKRALRTQLDLGARTSWSGRLIRAVDAALEEAPERFERGVGTWMVRGEQRPPAQNPDIPDLRERAWTVTPEENHMSETALLGAREGLRSVSDVVLTAAGPLQKAVLADIVADRFNTVFSVDLGYLDPEDERYEVPAPPGAPGAHQAALHLLGQLTSEERDLLGILATGGVRKLMRRTGATKHRASLIKDRLADKVSRLAGEHDADPQAIGEHLIELLGQLDSSGHSTHDGNHRDR
jgi:hypothetical protein